MISFLFFNPGPVFACLLIGDSLLWLYNPLISKPLWTNALKLPCSSGNTAGPSDVTWKDTAREPRAAWLSSLPTQQQRLGSWGDTAQKTAFYALPCCSYMIVLKTTLMLCVFTPDTLGNDYNYTEKRVQITWWALYTLNYKNRFATLLQLFLMKDLNQNNNINHSCV